MGHDDDRRAPSGTRQRPGADRNDRPAHASDRKWPAAVGHWLHQEQPGAFNRLLLDWLATIASP